MLVIVGESGSGKSTVADIIKKEYGYKGIVTYTTRPPREGEVNGVDYFFVSEQAFDDLYAAGFFAETAGYNGWLYGTPLNDCKDDRVVVLTPRGLRSLKKREDLNIFSVYLKVSRRERLIKLLQRGDDIEEAYRRSLSDVGQFDGVANEVDDVTIHRYNFSPEHLANLILNKYEAYKTYLYFEEE